MSDELDARLRELLIFSAPPTSFGLPRGLFVQLVVLAAGCAIALTWWFGALLFALAFAPLYRAHQSDPQALAVWAVALRERVTGACPFVASYLSVEID